jgi:hypothetical protein
MNKTIIMVAIIATITCGYFVYKYGYTKGEENTRLGITQDTVTNTVTYQETLYVDRVMTVFVPKVVSSPEKPDTAVITYKFDEKRVLSVTLSDSSGHWEMSKQTISVSGEFWDKPYREFRNLKVIPSPIQFRNRKVETLTVNREIVRPPFFTFALGLSTQGTNIGVGGQVSISALRLSADYGQFAPFYSARLEVFQW